MMHTCRQIVTPASERVVQTCGSSDKFRWLLFGQFYCFSRVLPLRLMIRMHNVCRNSGIR